jgi:hypothetical protein
MTDRSRSKSSARGLMDRIVSRRDLLRMGGAMIPAGILLPAWLTAGAQTTSTFDYYVSPTGNDANPGTVAQPWAITSLSLRSYNSNNVANCLKQAGKRVGFLPGTYDVSGLMYNDPVSGALQLIGGTAGANTVWASSDANGNYSPRTATIDAKGKSGLFGGHIASGPGTWDGPVISHTGSYPSNYATGYAVIDGLRVIGYSYKGIRVGGASSGDGPRITAPVTIQNCEFTGQGWNSGDYTDNMVSVWIDGCTGAVVSNNYLHDNLGQGGTSSADHLNAIIFWTCIDCTAQYNTCVASGSIYGKEVANQGSIIQYNYVDASMYTLNSTAIQDFTGANTAGLTHTTIIRNNILITQGGTAGGGCAIGWPTLSNNYGYSTPVKVYNNTIICTGNSGPVVVWATEQAGGSGMQAFQWFNNIYVRGNATGSWNGFGNFYTNPGAPQVWDYNLVPTSGTSWTLYQNGALTTALVSYQSAAAFSAGLAANGGISGAEAHTISGVPTFVGASGGALAKQYQLSSTSPGKGTGSSNGTPSGSACDMGAWGNGATQIGCNFTAGSTASTPVPMAPTLTVS